MTLSAIRAILRRRLGEPVAEYWTDANLLELINAAAAEVQKEFLKVVPDFAIRRWLTNTVAAQSLYLKPPMWHEVELALLDSTTGLYGTPLTRYDYDDARFHTTVTGYAIHGQYFCISPAPATSLNNGLRITGVPVLSMAADSDDLSPEIPAGLHMAIPVRAQIFALGETDDDTKKLWDEYRALTADLHMYFIKTGTTPEPIRPGGIDKGYRMGGSTGISNLNGVDQR